ncbi:isoleucine--tRNA ligase [archaeon]|nr:isoleucine--tRNA ligase [archaeon]MDD2477710.1 isoleucine--tRNA ligase [Candidatus ainarchaeum sp.]MDD3084563.1 isoleucine--tRNA ligase [Candidatus ainarchaeum sp.]MDD4221287.1 isoleucine--tRNA ligase [Candidatus ainarchaeum sp.]MDD4662779.1 isoleucine--tRNA ligase [Candidatus ainarchaeum sp.]
MFSNETENEIKKFWEEKQIPKKVREKESEKLDYFIDGPPYASGKLHLGTAMNRILKDIVFRFKRQKGYKVLDIPGFDCHGVPIEMKVQKKHDLKSKEDIEKFGIENFIKECYKFATEHIEDMSKEIYNLGQWLDWENPYRTLDQKYMQSAWWTFKKAYEKNLLYHGKYPVHICPSCETSVSFNEIEHKDLTDTSIYVTMQAVDDENLYFVIWTTTPWTLPANMGIMVHPKYEYVELISNNKKYIIAKDLVEKLIIEFDLKENYSLGKTYTGQDLVGKKYKPILGEWVNLSKDDENRAYRIIPSARYVNLEDGSGLVHCAPGHGKEDYQVGFENNLPFYSPVTMTGVYDETISKHSGKKVKELDPFIIEYLQEKGSLLSKKKIKHSYPTCWRCHSPLLQVALPQWFLKVEDLKPRLQELNEKEVTWFPTWGKDRFNDWLKTLSDWPISRARYWGIPIPIWKCEKCNKLHVFGSLQELKEKNPNVDLNMDIHKPYIDDVEITCDCGNKVKRIPEVFDVWFDSGVASWASLNYPFKKERFEKYWPPGMNIEGSDQIRGWWNSQIITSAIVFDKAPFKHIALHGMILDGARRKLSKSEGNDRPLQERFKELSIDYYRYYFAKEYDGTDLVMDESKFKDVKRIFNLLENVFSFLTIYNSNIDFIETFNVGQTELTTEDKWILSKFQTTLSESYNNYTTANFSKVIQDVEKFILEDLSRVYVKLLRKRKDKNLILNYVLSSTLLLLSPVIPHFTEYMFRKFKTTKESIHLCLLPEVKADMIDKDLETNFNVSQEIVTSVLSLREEDKKRLRWLLPHLVVQTESPEKLKDFRSIISDMTNISQVTISKEKPSGNFLSKEISKEITVHLDKDISKDYKEIWEVSELTRLIQDKRKKSNLNPNDVIDLKISSDDLSFLKDNKEKIETATSSNMRILDKLDPENKFKLIEREVSFSF